MAFLGGELAIIWPVPARNAPRLPHSAARVDYSFGFPHQGRMAVLQLRWQRSQTCWGWASFHALPLALGLLGGIATLAAGAEVPASHRGQARPPFRRLYRVSALREQRPTLGPVPLPCVLASFTLAEVGENAFQALGRSVPWRSVSKLSDRPFRSPRAMRPPPIC